MRHLRPTTALLVALALLAARPSFAQDLRAPDAVPFDETFVLDRAKALAQLIPGSPDYFYYTALDAQVKGDINTAEKILNDWDAAADKNLCRRDGRLREMRNRQMCLLWGGDPAKASGEIARQLGLSFDHLRPGKAQAERLPSVLPADFLDQARALNSLLADPRATLDSLDDDALPLLAGKNLGRDRTHQLLDRLGRLGRPDFPGAVDMTAADMAHWPGFGQRALDPQLTLAQLRLLAQKRPALLGDGAFVEAVALRLRPRDGLDAGHDPKAQLEYLSALVDFSRTLPANGVSFKASALFHKLAALQQAGQHDLALLKEYLALPRHSPIMPMERLRAVQERNIPLANLNQSRFTLPAIYPRENQVVHRELLHFLGENAAKTPTDFDHAPELEGLRETVDRDYLLRAYAEARITGNCPDPEAVYKLVPPDQLAQWRDRVDVELLPDNPAQVAADAVPELKIALKNVEKLTVRIHKLDMAAYYRAKGAELDPSVELDGQIPAIEKEISVGGDKFSPFLRHTETIPLDELKEPGAYVVELIGNGHSARAVVRKGRLLAFARPSAAGHLVFVNDENGKPVEGAQVALGTHLWTTDKEGRAAIPYTRADGEVGLQKAVITAGPLAALLPFHREKEQAQLGCAFDAPREGFVGGHEADLILTPQLYLNAQAADVSLLEDWRVDLQFALQDGTQISKRLDNLKVDANGRIALKVAVPMGAARVSAQAHARLPGAKTEDDVQVAANFSRNLGTNTVTRGLFVRKDGKETVLELRGANGEAVAGERVWVNFSGGVSWNRGGASLMTDAAGRVRLGVLPEGIAFQASAARANAHGGASGDEAQVIPSVINLAASEKISLPVKEPRASASGRGEDATPASLRARVFGPALFELRAGQKAVDVSDKLKVENGALAIAGLPAGDYELALPDRKIAIKVEDGPQAGTLVLGKDRLLDVSPIGQTPTLESWKVDGDDLVLKFTGAPEKLTISANRFAGAGAEIPATQANAWQAQLAPQDSQYLNGRVLDDEYRYVLERRKSPAFAGNMLARPGLLLNPWETQETKTGIQVGLKGELGERGAVMDMEGLTKQDGRYGSMALRPHFAKEPGSMSFPLDFLASPAWTRTDLTPDKDGVLRIPLKALGDRNLVSIAAVSGPIGWSRELALPISDIARRDLRNMQPLPAAQHLAEVRKVLWVAVTGTAGVHTGPGSAALRSGVEEGQTAGLKTGVPGAALKSSGPEEAARIETLGQYFQLLTALNPNLGADFAKFEPLTHWANLKDEAKLDFYKKNACHELHFFLWRRDKAFFEAQIKPFLQNKKDKTLVDKVLLGEDVKEYAQPAAFARLNAFERALLARAMKDDQLALHEAQVAGQVPVDLGFLDRVFRTASANGEKNGETFEGNSGSTMTMRGMHAASESLRQLDAPPPARAPAPVAEAAAGEANKDASGGRMMARKAARDEAKMRTNIIGKESTPLYRDPGAAKEWAESNWYHTQSAQADADLIPDSLFWADFAASDQPSPNFLLAHRNLHEALLALGAVDLPFKVDAAARRVETPDSKENTESKTHSQRGEPPRLLSCAVIASDLVPDAAPSKELSVVQRFFRTDDRQVVEKGRAHLKQHVGPYRPGVIYGAEVVVSNPTDTERDLNLLTQIPQGAIAVGGRATDGKPFQIAPFGSWRGEFLFYFPEEGNFTQYPAHVSEQGKVVGYADAPKFEVSRTAPAPITDAWVKMAAEGTPEQIQEWLKTKDLAGLDLSLCAWMMKDEAQFKQAIATLRARHYFDPTLWSYGVFHKDTPSAKEYLATTGLANEVGAWLTSPVLDVDPTKRGTYEHLEYSPFINARMLQLGKERTIPNEALRGQYARLLEVLRYKQELSARETGAAYTADTRVKGGKLALSSADTDDRLALAYYLMLQDRFEDASAQLSRIPLLMALRGGGEYVGKPFDGEAIALSSSKLQYDYLRAYLLFSQEKPEEARKIALRHKDIPIPHWKEKFAAVIQQADEITSGATTASPLDPAASSPLLEAQWKDGQLALTAARVGPVSVSLYPVDLEVLFSRAPFALAEGASAEVPVVKPARVISVEDAAKVDAAARRVEAPASSSVPETNRQRGELTRLLSIPADFAAKNLIVEVSGGGLRRVLTHQPHAFDLRLLETQGQLQVVGADGKPVAKAYVKVYAKRNGAAVFHKDGMTDLRGRFDYASLNTGLDGVESFAVLVVAPGGQGAVVRVVKPPAR